MNKGDNEMELQTRIHIAKADRGIRYSDRILMLGSCFTDHMAGRMQACCMQVEANPFGTLYNPLSIAETIKRMASAEPMQEADLVQHGGMYHSMMHHGDFSSMDAKGILEQTNKSIRDGHAALEQADIVILTWGTAYVYEYNGQVVANCHKLPASAFVRRILSVQEIVDAYTALLRLIPGKRVLLTVSPIRHLRDGMHENTVSKATLQLAADKLCQLSEMVSYFPSYEIMMDELRDYRFYAEDMVHPTEVAVQYIWERFVDTYMSTETKQEMQVLHRYWLDLHHRPLHPASEAYQRFIAQREKTREQLIKRYPWLP